MCGICVVLVWYFLGVICIRACGNVEVVGGGSGWVIGGDVGNSDCVKVDVVVSVRCRCT